MCRSPIFESDFSLWQIPFIAPTWYTQLVPQNYSQVSEEHQQLILGVKEYVFDPICSEKIGFSVKKMSISIQ